MLSRKPWSDAGGACPGSATSTASTAGCTASWSTPPSTRRSVGDEFETIVEISHAEPATSDDVQVIIDRDQLEQGFRRLSIDHRVVVVLHHYLGLPLADIADVLGIPVGTAKSRYHYAMAALRDALEAEGRVVTSREVAA